MLVENIKLALHSLAANKLRTFLTILGIIIGIASVVAIVTMGSSQTHDIEKQIAEFGINNINVYMWSNSDTESDDYSNMPYFDADKMKKMTAKYGDQIAALSFQEWGDSGKAYADASKRDTQYANISIMGINNGYLKVNNVSVTQGRTFSLGELTNGSSLAIVSDRLAVSIFGSEEKAVGEDIEIQTSDNSYRTYKIVGVYAAHITSDMIQNYRESGMKEQDISTDMYVPYQNVISNELDNMYAGKITQFDLQVAPGVDVVSFGTELQDYLQGLFKSEDNVQVEIYSNKQMLDEVTQSMSRQVATTTMIGAIALLVGGIGVMNIMTVSITERTREIGTRKALGAPNRAIRQQFITEAVVMCLIGGLFGLVGGLVAGYIGCRVMHYGFIVPVKTVVMAFAVSFAIGVFFGYYPANKAAKLDPIEALRYE